MAFKFDNKIMQSLGDLQKNDHEPRIQQHVLFISTILEWIQSYFDAHLFSIGEYNALVPLLFPDTHEAIHLVNKLEKKGYDDFDFVEKTLFRETRIILELIISWNKIALTDYNLLHVKLRVAIPQKISVIEEARDELAQSLEKIAELEKKDKIRRKYQRHCKESFDALPPSEQNRFLYNQYFDFSPGARSLTERKKAIAQTKKTVSSQQKKIDIFKARVAEQIEGTGTKAGQLISELSAINQLKVLTQAKLEKQRYTKEEQNAKNRVKKGMHELEFQIKKGSIPKMVNAAIHTLERKKRDLKRAEQSKQELIRILGELQIKKSHAFVGGVRGHLEEEQRESELLFQSARNYLAKAKIHLESEQEDARKVKEKEEEFLRNARNTLAQHEKQAHNRLQDEKQRVLGLGIHAQEKFQSQLTQYQLDTEIRVRRDELRLARLRSELETRKTKEKARISLFYQSQLEEKKQSLKKYSEDRIGESISPATSAITHKEKLQQQIISTTNTRRTAMIKRKKLVAYDIRFAQERINQDAAKQNEQLQHRFEEFKEKQELLIARHRARQKSNIIRNAMRMMRKAK